jgi:2-dehydropantoate 2-reductase
VKLLVLGAGGIGGYFGGRLAAAGVDVTFLVRPKRREQLERDGMRIESHAGNVQVPVKTVDASELKPGYDVVLLTCKAYDLDSAMEAIAPAVEGKCGVLPVLNGMAHLDRLDERFGRASVMGGTCSINVTLTQDGTIRHVGAMQRLAFGERDGSRSARAQAFADAIARTSIDWELADDIQQNLWEKIVFLSALAATTCLFRASVGEILSASGGREALERTLATNIAIAMHEGHQPREAALTFARGVLTEPSALTASMLRDIESGGRVESDHIVGWMLDKARTHHLDDTMLSLAYTHLKAYEARRDAGRLTPAPSRT